MKLLKSEISKFEVIEQKDMQSTLKTIKKIVEHKLFVPSQLDTQIIHESTT